MDDFLGSILSDNALAVGVAAIIVFVTFILAIKKWIGFSMTFLFLLFSLAAGAMIANHDILRSYLEGTVHESHKAADLKAANFQEQVLKAYDNLRAEVEIQKRQIQFLNESLKSKEKSRNTE